MAEADADAEDADDEAEDADAEAEEEAELADELALLLAELAEELALLLDRLAEEEAEEDKELMELMEDVPVDVAVPEVEAEAETIPPAIVKPEEKFG